MDTPTLDSFIEKMEKLYADHSYRLSLGKKGYDIATHKKYKWEVIAAQFNTVFTKVLKERENFRTSVAARIEKK